MQEMIDCPDCEDGWCALPKRKCGNCRFNTGSLPPPNSDRINCSLRRCILAGWPHYDHRCDDHDYMRGTDQAILCPACEEAK